MIAGRLPGRTDNEVKNYWNSHLRRKLMNMGIDPNNHRLNQNPPRSQNPCASGSTTSFASKEIVSHPLKTRLLWKNDQLSEAASCLEDYSTRCLPDLNLDLKITIDHSSSVSVVEEEKKKIDESTLSRDSECDTRPTLLPFASYF